MTSSGNKRVARRDFILAAIAIAAGLTVTGASLLQLTLWNEPQHVAQAQTTQLDQSGKTNAPALPTVPAGKSAPPVNAK